MANLTAPQIIVSIVVPVLIIVIIIYLYKDKIIRFGKKVRSNVKHLPIGEDTKEEKQRNKEKNEDTTKNKKMFKSRIPKLFSLF
tara:strand:- start:161 stop:412 length:252 start_codon:yes stop_codon:yes gene_type:complete